jgi:hypothetical protein
VDETAWPPTTSLPPPARTSRRRIERLVTALAAGTDELPSLRSALASLERERARLERELAQSNDRRKLGGHGRDQLVASLIEKLSGVRDVLTTGPAEERKTMVPTLLHGITIDKVNSRAVPRCYRPPPDAEL